VDNVNSLTGQIHPKLVDRMLELYCDWRTASAEVQAAYERFSRTEGSDRAHAFAAYTAALDREGMAADAYEAQISVITSRSAADFNVRAHDRSTRRRWPWSQIAAES
jgi:hypothetical protein